MRIIFQLTILTLIFSLNAFTQEKNYREVKSEKLRQVHKPNAYGLQGASSIEHLLLKSKCSDWQPALKNHLSEFYKEQGFNSKEARTTLTKTLLSNGFLLIEQIGYDWDGATWVNTDKYSSTYDGDNNIIEELWQPWNGTTWVNEGKWSYTYDGSNNQTEWLHQTWDDSAWINSQKHSYIYDGDKNLVEEVWLVSFNGIEWVNLDKYWSYTYDGFNNLKEQFHQIWNGYAWENFERQYMTYDENNIPAESIVQRWDGLAWENSMKFFISFDGNNNLLGWLIQIWNDSTWENLLKNSNTLNENDNITEQLYQYWLDSAWVNTTKYSYLYDTNHNQMRNSINIGLILFG